jgi:hypothetical protein
MSVRKLSADVKARIRVNIASWEADYLDAPTNSAIVKYRALLEDTGFWQNADREPQLRESGLGGWGYAIDEGISVLDRQYIFQNCAYAVRGIFTPEQDKLLVQDAFDSERRQFERLQNKFNLAQHTEPRTERTGIPEEVRIAVWRRDNGRCVRCGSRERLEYDHIIPVSRGGSSTVRNIELLCEICNRSKAANIQ